MADLSGLYALPAGVDFAAAFADGLIARMAARPPEALAQVTIHANSGRTLTALRAAFETRGPLLLPRLRLLADLGAEGADTPLAAPLARRMQLARLIEAIPPDARPGQSVPELAATLSEMCLRFGTGARIGLGEVCERDGLDAFTMLFSESQARALLAAQRPDLAARLVAVAVAALALALRIGVNHGGDSDSTASLAGQLLGARHGVAVLGRADAAVDAEAAAAELADRLLMAEVDEHAVLVRLLDRERDPGARLEDELTPDIIA